MKTLEMNTPTMIFFHLLLNLLKNMIVVPKEIKAIVEGEITTGRSFLKDLLNTWLKQRCVKANDSSFKMRNGRSREIRDKVYVKFVQKVI